MIRTNDASWNKLISWLEVRAWSPITAAHILIDLDPDSTYGPNEDYGLCIAWLTDYRPAGLPSDEYSLLKNIEMLLEHSIGLTNRVDRVKVQTPQQWIKWCVEARLEPAWLKPAFSVDRVSILLPVGLPEYRNEPERAKSLRGVASMGGQAKARRSPAGKAKIRLMPLIDARLRSGTVGKVATLVEECLAVLERHDGERAEPETIQKWIAQVKKRIR